MQKFSYTARRGQFLSIVLLFTFLVTVEAGGMFLLSALLLQGTLRLIVELVVGGFHLFMLLFLYGPLFTRHRLTPDRLILHYSWMFKADLPRSALVTATPVKENLPSGLATRANYTGATQELRLPFSDLGQVWLYLDQPYQLKVGFRSMPVKSILINVDRRDEFLKSLAVPAELVAPRQNTASARV